MKIVPVQTWAEGNEIYPLPPDYYARRMSDEDRRCWRVNACRQWLLHNSNATDETASKAAMRRKKAEAFVASMHFFDQYYLKPELAADGTSVFDPFFYSQAMPTPEYHWHLCRAAMMYRKVAAIGPRGSAKTFHNKKRVMLQMLSRPRYLFTYATSTNELTELFGEDTKYQLYENARIFDDWSREEEFEGRIKPRRGEAMAGMKGYALSNRSSLFCTSAESRQRGGRPTTYILDDPEWDPKNSTPMEVLREWFEHMLFRMVLPMIQQPGTNIIWDGTYVSQQHYLWHATHTEEVIEDGVARRVPLDSRFASWYRIIQPAEVHVEVPDPVEPSKKISVRVSAWPEMWPCDDEEKKRLELPDDTQALDDIRKEIGDAAYEAEYMARPGSGVAAYFPILEDKKHGYWFEQVDHLILDKPILSKTLMCFYREVVRGTVSIVKEPLDEFLGRCTRFTCCDPSLTSGPHSDYKTAVTMCLSSYNELFVLDAWAMQCEEDDQALSAFQQADRWKVHVLANENSKDGMALNSRIEDIIKTRAGDVMGVSHLPEHHAFPPANSPKCAKIATLKWRFLHGLIKLPFKYKGDRSTAWPMLFAQIGGFKNLGGDNTGLHKDDLLDTIQMSREVIGGVPMRQQKALEEAKTAAQKLAEGQDIDPATGQSLIVSAALNLTRQDLSTILHARAERARTTDPTIPSLNRARGVA